MTDKEKTKQQLIEELDRLRREMAELKDEYSALQQVFQQTKGEYDDLLVAERNQRELAETLSELFLLMVAQTSREGILDEILRLVRRVVPCNAVNIALYEGRVLRTVRRQGYEAFGKNDLLINLNQPLAEFPLDATVVHSRQPLVVYDTQQTPKWVTNIETAWIKAFVAVPICLQERVLGLLRLDSDTPYKFSANDAERLQPLANAAAIALENNRLYDQLHRELVHRLEIETELRQVAARNQAMLNAIPDSLFYFNRDGQLLDYKVANTNDLVPGTQGRILINSDPNERLGVSSDLVGLIQTHINQTLVPGETQIFECSLSLPQDEKTFEVRLTASGPIEVLAIVRNITRRRRMEEALKKSVANLRTILDNSLLALILIDESRKIQAFNKAANDGIKALLGKRLNLGDSIYGFVAEEELDEFNRCFEQAMQGNPVSIERSIHIGNGDRWFEFRYNPVFADDGLVLGVCLSTLDIDQHKKMTNALLDSEARLLAEMQSVLVIARALVSELNLDTLLEFIIIQAENLMNATGAVVMLLSEDRQWLEAAIPGEAWSLIKPGTRIPYSGSLAELAITSQQVQMSNQVQLDDRVPFLRTLLQPVKAVSLLCAPLIAQRKNLGVLVVWSEFEQAFSEHDKRLIGLFADQAALALHNAHLHAQNRKLAIEQERHRLARELHDSVNQSLHSIGLAAKSTLRLLGPKSASELRDRIEFIQTVASTALVEMRKQLHDLQPTDLIDKGLVEALTQYVDTLRKQYPFTIQFKPEVELPISIYQQVGLYYIAREALWNVVKHANATRVELTLSQDNDQIILSLVDNGVGFDPIGLGVVGTQGIRNMEERTMLLGGTIELQSMPGHGTRLTVNVPLNVP